MFLDEAKLDELQRQHGKIGVVEYNGHQIVFSRPTRDIAREYRRMKETPAEAPDMMDRLAQSTIIAFDGETDANASRALFTGTFLANYPLATSSPKFNAVLSILSGYWEDEDAAALGKGARIKGLSPPPSPKG